MRFKTVLVGLLLSTVLFAETVTALRFTWAVVYQRSGEKSQAIDYASRIVRLQSGDRLRIHFQPHSRCYLYVYLHDAEQNLYLLQQTAFGFQGTGNIGLIYTLPEGDGWYFLDGSGGVELIYLIVSDHRLRRLEALTRGSLSREAGDSAWPRLARKQPVLDEIQRTIRQSSSLAEPLQKPVTMAGNFRGISEETEVEGVDVEAASLYVRTIRLEH